MPGDGVDHHSAYPLLPSERSSAGPSRTSSRRNSGERPRKVRLSDDLERYGETSGRSTPLSLHGRKSVDHGSGDRATLFKAPVELGDEDEHSASAPLLSVPSGGRATSSEEERELWEAEGPNSGVRGTLLDGIANMANSILGAGIIGLPYAIARAGFVMGILLLIVLAGVTDWTIRLVVLNAKLSGRESYTEVMHHCFGHWGSAGVSFFQFAFAFGGMCAFSVIIGDTIPHVIIYLFPAMTEHAVLSFLVDRRTIIVLCTMAISFPLSLHRDIVKLSKSSGFALISMCVIVTTVVLRGVAVEPELRGPPLHAVSLIRSGVFEAIGVISFAFVCHHNTIFIYKSLSTPTLDRFYAVTHVSTAMSLFCCLLMAVSGYVVFTSKTEGNILNNFSPDDLMVNIARLCFGANMSTTIPLENYVCREVIEEYFFKDKPFSQTRHIVTTACIVFSSMLISLMTCDLGVVLEIAGGLSATALAFIFPASAYIVLTKGKWYDRAKLPAVACTVFGVVVLVLSCGLTIVKAFSGEATSKKC